MLKIRFAIIYVITVVSIYHYQSIFTFIFQEKLDFFDVGHVANFWNFNGMSYFEIVSGRVETHQNMSTNIELHFKSHHMSISLKLNEFWYLDGPIVLDRQILFWSESKACDFYRTSYIFFKSPHIGLFNDI